MNLTPELLLELERLLNDKLGHHHGYVLLIDAGNGQTAIVSPYRDETLVTLLKHFATIAIASNN